LREKIGVVFGSSETTTGGRALKFYASIRLDVRRVTGIKEKGEVIGSRTRVRVTKNKVAPPFRVAEFDIIYGKGISREGDILDLAVQYGIIEKRGSFYSYQGQNIAQGRENAKQYLRDHPEVMAEVEQQVREKAMEAPPPLITEDVEPA
jgi:recombination protein RecA